MAALALGIVGGIIGPSISGAAYAATIGTAIGAVVGGVIDSMLIYPAIFGQGNTNISGPRLDELRLQTASYGSKVAKCWGPQNRVAGTLIYISDLDEVKTTQSSGGGGKGGGGGGSTSTTYTYYVDLAIAVCEGPIESIKRIWADGKLIYDSDNDINLSGSDITCTNLSGAVVYSWAAGFGSPNPKPDRMKLTAPIGGTALKSLHSGIEVTVAGFSNAVNNGTFVVESTGTEGSTRFAILKNPDCVDEAAGAAITLDQVISAYDKSKIGNLHIHKGTSVQNPDSILEAQFGAGNVPAFRGTAYVVISSFLLTDFGNRIPQFNFEVEADTTLSIQDLTEGLLARAGLDAARWNTDALAPLGNVDGYTVAGPTTTAAALEPILIWKDLIARDNSAELEFVVRDDEDVVEVDSDDLAAHEFSSAPPEQLVLHDVDTLSIPRRVTVKYVSFNNDYNTDTAEHQRIDYVDGEHEMVLDIPITLSHTEAKKLAQRILWYGYRDRITAEMTLPPRYLHLLEGDVVELQDGTEARMFVKEKSRGENGTIEVRGTIRSITEVDFEPEEGDVLTPPDSTVYQPPLMATVIVDTAPLRDVDATIPGYYVAASAADIEAVFFGSAMYSSTDDATYNAVTAFAVESTVVFALTALPDGPIGIWDEESTVDVAMVQGSLASAGSDLEVYNGANRVYLGQEIIAFRTATLIAENSYRLSGLLRGLRDTWRFTSTHSIGEYGTVLDTSLQFIPINLAACGQLQYLKNASSGMLLNDLDAELFAPQCNSVRPLSPAHFAVSRSGIGDATYTWTRVTRATARLFSGSEVPNLSASERYEVDIYATTDGSFGGSVVRTLSTTTSSVTYSATDQVADGLTLHTSYDARVYEIDTATVGRGNAAEGTL